MPVDTLDRTHHVGMGCGCGQADDHCDQQPSASSSPRMMGTGCIGCSQLTSECSKGDELSSPSLLPPGSPSPPCGQRGLSTEGAGDNRGGVYLLRLGSKKCDPWTRRTAAHTRRIGCVLWRGFSTWLLLGSGPARRAGGKRPQRETGACSLVWLGPPPRPLFVAPWVPSAG